eukprot:g14579.t1
MVADEIRDFYLHVDVRVPKDFIEAASKKAYFKQKSLVEKASRNAKKDLVRDLESKRVEVVTIQSGRHISVLAAESDVAVGSPLQGSLYTNETVFVFSVFFFNT